MAHYKSFGEVAAAWASKHNVVKARDEALDESATIAQTWAKLQYGGGGTSPKTLDRGQIRKKGHDRPLFETGMLKEGVEKLKVGTDTRVVHQKDKLLGGWHEAGTPNMPARVIWGRAKTEIGGMVVGKMKATVKKHLTN